MSQKVFVVYEHDWYEFQGIEAVFSTREKATEYIKARTGPTGRQCFHDFQISEVEFDPS